MNFGIVNHYAFFRVFGSLSNVFMWCLLADWKTNVTFVPKRVKQRDYGTGW